MMKCACWPALAGVLCVLSTALAQPPAPAQQPAQPPAATAPAIPGTAGDQKSTPVLCPVTGKPIDRKVVARYRGKWVYFADADAKQKFEQNPGAFADGLKNQWAANRPARIQVKCPVTDKPPAAEIFIGLGEDAVFFATDEARKKYEADPKAYQKRLENECYSFQTQCGTCEMEIDPKVARTVDGRTVYFCCDGCAGQFEAKKTEYFARLDQQVRDNKAAYIRRQFEKALGQKADGGKSGDAKPAPAPPATQPAAR